MRFKRNIRKLQTVFPKAQIVWLEIFTSGSGGYEEHRPGVIKRINEYNEILRKNLKNGFVPIQAELNSVNGVNADHLHLNRKGHLRIFELLKNRIQSFYEQKNSAQEENIEKKVIEKKDRETKNGGESPTDELMAKDSGVTK